MISGRGSESFLLSERGQSALIGVILLIGMAATVSVGVLLVAGDVMNGAQQQSQNQRVEQGFVELGHEMSTVSVSDDSSRTVSFEGGKSGAVTKTKAGWIHIEGGDVDINRSIGAVEYVGDDGTIVAYQSGGVWRETGNKTRMLSAPNIDYDSEDETLWFPITTLSGNQKLDSGDISIEHNSTDPVGNVSFVENDSVTITVQSDYYRGWERYFREEASGASVQNVYHENRTVHVLLGYAELDGAFENGATIGSDNEDHLENHKDEFWTDPRTGTPYPEMDPVIEDIVEDGKAGENVTENLSSGKSYDSLNDGTYFIEEIDGDQDYEFDLSSGNATLIVEDNVTLGSNGSITVQQETPGENVLRIYSGGNYTRLDGDICADDCGTNAEVIQFYGPSTMSVDFGPGNAGAFEGVLYVASSEEKDWYHSNKGNGNGNCNDDHQIHMQAKGDFYGSFVAYSACGHSSSATFNYDEDLASANIDPYYADYSLPPQITYLNIAVHELDVKNE